MKSQNGTTEINHAGVPIFIPTPLKNVSDADLLLRTDRLVKQETHITTAILHHLREIDDRKLYAEKNCDSLFTYCTRVLRYSESQAHRRITAARLLRQIPDLDKKIEDGRLTLSNIVQAQSFFHHERRAGRPVPIERKTLILSKLEEKSSREAERILVAENPDGRPLRRESLRFITEDRAELKITLDLALLKKLTRIKVLAGHKLPESNWADIIDMICDEVLERHDPVIKAKRALNRAAKTPRKSRTQTRMPATAASTKTPYDADAKSETASTANGSGPTASISPRTLVSTSKASVFALSKQQAYRTAIPAATKHAVWRRDEGCCAHVDPTTGVRCRSVLRIEIDHIHPIASGGTNDLKNLRLLCRAHNLRRNFTQENNVQINSQSPEPP